MVFKFLKVTGLLHTTTMLLLDHGHGMELIQLGKQNIVFAGGGELEMLRLGAHLLTGYGLDEAGEVVLGPFAFEGIARGL